MLIAMAVFLDFLRCAEHQSYCGKHNLVFTLSCMPLQPNNRRTKWPRNSHYTPNIQNVSVGAATNIVQPMTFSVAMALVEHSILLKCWAKIGISGAIGVSRMPLTQRQRVNIQRNLTVAGLPYWRLSMAAFLRIADRVGLRAKRPQLADSTSTRGCPKAAARVISTRSRNPWLDFSLFRNFQRVIHLDAEVSDRTFQFGMAKQ